MSKQINDGGPAFPYGQENFTEKFSKGMSLRDWFAGQALAGVLDDYRKGYAEMNQHELAKSCFIYADAMILEREMVKGKKI